MRLRISALSLLFLCPLLTAVPATAGDVYDNGPINGNTYGWTINLGFAVSDTFTINAAAATLTGLSFGAWLIPGDTVTALEVSVSSNEFGGTVYFDQIVNLSQGGCTTNQFGYNVCTETGSFLPFNLVAGTYWLNLQNAMVPSGDPVFWDENSGPSQASENFIGTIPSESFTLLGSAQTTTPEPESIVLLATGTIAIGGALRRKLM